MGQIAISILVVIFGPIASIILERYMTNAPEWIWKIAPIGCITAGIIIAILSDPIYQILRNPKEFPIISTSLVCSFAAIIFGGIWYFGILPSTLLEQINSGSSTNSQQKQVIIQIPSIGNLKERAIILSEEIMEDLYEHGWRDYLFKNSPDKFPFPIKKMPTTPEEAKGWGESRSRYFRFKFFEKVLDIRDEFSQLHIRDQKLDDFFKYYGGGQEIDRNWSATSVHNAPVISPMIIEGVAERLKVMAEQVK